MLWAFQLAQIGLITAITLEVPFRQLDPVYVVPIVIPWAVMPFSTYRRRREFLQVLVCMKEGVLRHDGSTVDDEECQEADAEPGTWSSFAFTCLERGTKTDVTLAVIAVAWGVCLFHPSSYSPLNFLSQSSSSVRPQSNATSGLIVNRWY